MNKKRTHAVDVNQAKLYERDALSSVPRTTPKRTQSTMSAFSSKARGQQNDEGEVEPFDVAKAIQKRNDEKEFKKEFGKDMRKINKIKETDPAAAGNVEEQKAAFTSMLDKE